MYRVTVGASHGLRTILATTLAALLLVSFTSDSADAARWRKKRVATPASSSSITANPQYAAIVVDANSSDILHAANADSQRHPASLTKIMTLYLLFERLEAGKVSLNTQLPVSARASAQAPTKLGLRPGQSISVEDAIKALVTKSANDIAVVIAEALGGSEDEFARMMTRKARALRMTRTVYRNASGLPDSEQVTTARDQALLGLAIQDRFPNYYRYFSTRVFTYKGRNMGNHNRLLGRVEGMDGIKTGYTRMSGFNLVSSVRRGNRHIVAVVLGGRSAGQRDARMRDLIEARIVQASIKRTAPKATEIAAVQEPVRQESAKPVRVAAAAPAKAEVKTEAKAEAPARPEVVAAATEANKPIPLVPQPAAGSTDPIKPRMVKTVAVRPGRTQVASLTPMPLPDTAASNDAPAHDTRADDRPLSPPPGARPGVLGVLTAKDFKEQSRIASAASDVTSSAALPSSPARASARAVKPRSGWIIQVGAFPDKSEALQKIETVKNKASKYVSDADSFTEPVSKGDKTLYRARFAGFKQQQAEAACRYLKQNDFACMAIRN